MEAVSTRVRQKRDRASANLRAIRLENLAATGANGVHIASFYDSLLKGDGRIYGVPTS